MASSIIEKMMAAKSAPKEDVDMTADPAEDSSMDGTEAAAQEALDAIEAKDAKAFAEAIKSLVEMVKE